jgi:tryptophan synthase alpha chain
MNAIDALFARLRTQGKKAFIPFVTAGDPDLNTTSHLVLELVGQGASLVEIGFPFSDPIADGPVIQASYHRALERGLRLESIFESLRDLTKSARYRANPVPLVGMISYTLVHRRGPQAFLQQGQAAGLCGAIVPDLPIDEADDLMRAAADCDFKLIQLITPTTPRDRAVRIAQRSTGFIYYVSVMGITGERDRLPQGLIGQLQWLRGQTDLPICVGFGISRPEHVRMLREVADGVIVGSALVRQLEQIGMKSVAEVTAEIGALVRTLCEALNPAEGRANS